MIEESVEGRMKRGWRQIVFAIQKLGIHFPCNGK
jgi:hypothetical protein